MTDDDNFFSRWSRRKTLVRTGQALPAEPVAPPPAAASAVVPVSPSLPQTQPPSDSSAGDIGPGDPSQAPAKAQPPLPTMEDVSQLTPASDFSAFVGKEVPADVRNAAVKKLFADPHYNVMDGLDIYIEDYTRTEPIPAAMMARMASAQFLKLVDDPQEKMRTPPEEAPVPAPDLPAAPIQEERAEALAPNEETHDDHPDLQLQPDNDPGPSSPGSGAG